jgi:hypothetical protein
MTTKQVSVQTQTIVAEQEYQASGSADQDCQASGSADQEPYAITSAGQGYQAMHQDYPQGGVSGMLPLPAGPTHMSPLGPVQSRPRPFDPSAKLLC